MFDLTDALGQVAEQPVVVDPADAYTALSYAYAEQTRELERYKAAHLVASEKVAAFQGALTIALAQLESDVDELRKVGRLEVARFSELAVLTIHHSIAKVR